MTTIKPFSLLDIFSYSSINLDILTETFGDKFYGKYISKWPEYCKSLINGENRIQAYLLGKVEGSIPEKSWHGHITAVTVAPNARRQGIARYFMDYLKMVSEKIHDAFYVDLFVRPSNQVAVGMYRYLGYGVFQIVDKYYSKGRGEGSQAEDCYDMRLGLERNLDGLFVKPTGKVIKPSEVKFR